MGHAHNDTQKEKRELRRVFAYAAKDDRLLDLLLEDILTPKEYHDIARRWQIVQQLDAHVPQRQVAKDLGVSISKITRGSRMLLNPAGGFHRMLERLHP